MLLIELNIKYVEVLLNIIVEQKQKEEVIKQKNYVTCVANPQTVNVLFSAALATTQHGSTMEYQTEAPLDLQLAPTPAAPSLWPHWSWGVLLCGALVILGLLGVCCCYKR